MRDNPNRGSKPYDMSGKAVAEWKHKISKMLYRCLRGDFIFRQKNVGKKENEIEHEVFQQSHLWDTKMYYYIQELRDEAASETNLNPQAMIYYPRY